MYTSFIFILLNTNIFEHLILTIEQFSMSGVYKKLFISNGNVMVTFIFIIIYVLFLIFFNILKINSIDTTVSNQCLKKNVTNACTVRNVYQAILHAEFKYLRNNALKLLLTIVKMRRGAAAGQHFKYLVQFGAARFKPGSFGFFA